MLKRANSICWQPLTLVNSMAVARPYRGLHPYLRLVEKSGLGLRNSTGWKQSTVVEISTTQANGRPVFYQFNVCGERNMLINAYVPKAWRVPPHNVS